MEVEGVKQMKEERNLGEGKERGMKERWKGKEK